MKFGKSNELTKLFDERAESRNKKSDLFNGMVVAWRKLFLQLACLFKRSNPVATPQIPYLSFKDAGMSQSM